MASAPSSSAKLKASAPPPAEIIDGRLAAADITARVAVETDRLEAERAITPGLAVVLVGDDPASKVYVAGKTRTAEEIGFLSVQHTLPAEASEGEVLGLVEKLNHDQSIHGILVQLPLPWGVDRNRVIQAIRPEKDVDGLHPINAGRLAAGDPEAVVPCTPAGCLLLIKRAAQRPLAGLNAVVVGRSTLVGRPMAQLLLGQDCTVTIAHSKTRDLAEIVRGGDIVVAATGRPQMIRGSWLKPGAIVIDVGMNRIAAPELGEGKMRLVGDVAFQEALAVARAITPVPGGVGPMTIAMLMANTLAAAYRSVRLPQPVFN
jgi:methylenetetrahydrofolate dehydrogenase (NADP+) / methenyltetrahydrofolate cyclohydrolase